MVFGVNLPVRLFPKDMPTWQHLIYMSLHAITFPTNRNGDVAYQAAVICIAEPHHNEMTAAVATIIIIQQL